MSWASQRSTPGSEGSPQNTTLRNIKNTRLQSDLTPQVSAGHTAIARVQHTHWSPYLFLLSTKLHITNQQTKTRAKEKTTRQLQILRNFAVPQNDMMVAQTTDQHRARLSAVTVLKMGCFCIPNMSPPASTVSDSGTTSYVKKTSEVQRL